MPATISHSLSMTTPNDPAYEKVLRRREANRRSYEKHKEERQRKSREYQRKRHAENKDHVRALQNKWNAENKDRIEARRKVIRPKYKDKELAYGRKWYAENKEKSKTYYLANKDKWRERYRKWSSENLDKEAARAARRRAGIYRATPPWADLSAIRAVYASAARMSEEHGIKYHVDHVVPLNGKNVCGLHVHWNLQILTASENCRKNNKCLEASTIS